MPHRSWRATGLAFGNWLRSLRQRRQTRSGGDGWCWRPATVQGWQNYQRHNLIKHWVATWQPGRRPADHGGGQQAGSDAFREPLEARGRRGDQLDTLLAAWRDGIADPLRLAVANRAGSTTRPASAATPQHLRRRFQRRRGACQLSGRIWPTTRASSRVVSSPGWPTVLLRGPPSPAGRCPAPEPPVMSTLPDAQMPAAPKPLIPCAFPAWQPAVPKPAPAPADLHHRRLTCGWSAPATRPTRRRSAPLSRLTSCGGDLHRAATRAARPHRAAWPKPPAASWPTGRSDGGVGRISYPTTCITSYAPSTANVRPQAAAGGQMDRRGAVSLHPRLVQPHARTRLR